MGPAYQGLIKPFLVSFDEITLPSTVVVVVVVSGSGSVSVSLSLSRILCKRALIRVPVARAAPRRSPRTQCQSPATRNLLASWRYDDEPSKCSFRVSRLRCFAFPQRARRPTGRPSTTIFHNFNFVSVRRVLPLSRVRLPKFCPSKAKKLLIYRINCCL